MSTIVTRAGKGSALTWTEGDQNLINLNTDKIESIIDDLTPQLGGNLDVNNNKIIAGLNGIVEIDSDDTRITLAHDSLKVDEVNLGDEENPFYASRISNTGTNALYFSGPVIGFGSTMATILNSDGSIDLRSTNLKFGMPSESGVSQVITTPNVGDTLVLNTGSGTDSGNISVIGGTNGNIEIQPNGTGKIKLDTHLWPNTDGTADQVLKTDGLGNLSWTTISSGATNLDGLSDVVITAPTISQLLQYNGTSWINATVSSGIASVSADTAPSLGGNLTVNGKSIISANNGNIVLAPNGTGIIRADKSVQIQSQGELRLADSDSSNYVGFRSPSTVSTNRIWTLPATDGTSGQVLSTNGSGTLSWATAGGGNNTIILNISQGWITFPATSNANMNQDWTLESTGGISGVSVSTNTFTLPAGTYHFKFPFSTSGSAAKSNWHLRNITDSSTPFTIQYDSFLIGSTSVALYGSPSKTITISGSKTFTLRTDSAVSGGWTLLSGHWSSGYSLMIIKTA